MPSPSPLFITVLRYDDTNPEAEKKEYIDHIEEIVQWMGWKPFKITYTSGYFQELYELAVELIRSGHAYVDHQTPDAIKEYREKKLSSPWRDRPISESLKLFEDMKRGVIEEGKATLRMKQDMQSENYNMYDLIAYRMHLSMIACSTVVPIYLEISVYSKYSLGIKIWICDCPILFISVQFSRTRDIQNLGLFFYMHPIHSQGKHHI